MECHIRALPTPSANDGPRFHTNISDSELIEHDTRAIEASVINSAHPIAEAVDGVIVTEPTNYTKLSKKIIHQSRRLSKLKPV